MLATQRLQLARASFAVASSSPQLGEDAGSEGDASCWDGPPSPHGGCSSPLAALSPCVHRKPNLEDLSMGSGQPGGEELQGALVGAFKQVRN